jgi:hypothetical protein
MDRVDGLVAATVLFALIAAFYGDFAGRPA